MNILFLDSIEKETYGGMEEWIRLTAHGLASRGHKILIAGRPESRFLVRVTQGEGSVEIHPIDIHGDFGPTTIAKLKKIIAINDIELITGNFNKDIRLGGLAARLDGRPRVIWSVGLDITKDNLIHRYLTPKLLDGVVVPSVALKKQITRHGFINNDIVKVIPIGIPEQTETNLGESTFPELRRKYHLPNDAVIAVTVGRFVDQKGHIYLVEAAREIVKQNPDIKFLLVGDGPLRSDLETLMTERKVRESFVFTGMLDRLDLELIGADLMIHPSVEEPFGIAVLEGMRAGLPVVASKVGGIPEVVSEGITAELVTPRNSRELAHIVCRLLADPKKYREMGTAGHKRWSESFRLETMIDRVERYFTACILRTEFVNG